MTSAVHWVGTWATAPAPAEGAALSNQTLRMNARISIGGDTLRVRLSNAYGVGPLTIGAAHLGLRDSGPGIVPSSDRVLTFGGATSATIAAGSLLLSDPVQVSVAPSSDLVVTFWLPERAADKFRDYWTLCAADELHFATWRLFCRAGDAGWPHH